MPEVPVEELPMPLREAGEGAAGRAGRDGGAKGHRRCQVV
jgi:hypothetical protein